MNRVNEGAKVAGTLSRALSSVSRFKFEIVVTTVLYGAEMCGFYCQRIKKIEFNGNKKSEKYIWCDCWGIGLGMKKLGEE